MYGCKLLILNRTFRPGLIQIGALGEWKLSSMCSGNAFLKTMDKQTKGCSLIKLTSLIKIMNIN